MPSSAIVDHRRPKVRDLMYVCKREEPAIQVKHNIAVQSNQEASPKPKLNLSLPQGVELKVFGDS